MRIPKRIIHIFCVPSDQHPELPLLNQAARANAMLLNPNFEHLLFDTDKVDQFLQKEFPEYLAVFASFQYPIQRFDFFRYLAIYRLGGFYMDLDVILARNLDPLLSFDCVFPFEELTMSGFLRSRHGIDWEIGNYAFGAAPGHPFIKAVIENCVKAQENPSWGIQMLEGIPRPFREQYLVPNTTGPGLVSRTLAERRDLRGTVTVLFPDDVCDERTWHRFGEFGVHLMSASWRKRESFIRTRLARFWEIRLRKQLLRESQRLGGSRNGDWVTHLCRS